MKINENTLLFVLGIVLMFFASYVFKSTHDAHSAFRIILFSIGMTFSILSAVNIFISQNDNKLS